MNYNTDELLQQGITAHRAGKAQDAERLYRSILQQQPNHPDANHNLGVLTLSLGKTELSLTYFKAAVEANPKQNLFLLSMIDALIKAGEFNNANKIIQKSRDSGLKGEKFEQLVMQLASNFYNLGITLQQKGDPISASEYFKSAIQLNPDHIKAHSNLGIALQQRGDPIGAIESFRRAVELNPNSAQLHSNLGNTLLETGDHVSAVESLRRAIQIKPTLADLHSNLAKALEQTDINAAIEGYQRALQLNPDLKIANYNLGLAFITLGQFDKALPYHEKADTPKSFAKSLLCLYALGLYEQFDSRVREYDEIHKVNISVAAICAFVSNQTNRKNTHKFCRNPLEFLNFGHLSQHIDDSNDFIKKLDEELSLKKGLWEPQENTTHNGFQTTGNLFVAQSGCITKLEGIIENEIASYYEKFKSSTCLFMELWPKKSALLGWSVRLHQNGYQSAHIHPGGWLSGVFYLKLIKSKKQDEGAIEFSLCGKDYPILDKGYPKFLYRPKKGDIVLFPSSLYHRTIPFKNDEERLVVAFDLVPQSG